MTEQTAPASVLVCWVGDIPRIRAFLDAAGVRYDLSDWGRRGEFTVEIQQKATGRFYRAVTAHIGDRITVEDGQIKVAKRTPNRRKPPPGAARVAGGRARRDRSGGVR